MAKKKKRKKGYHDIEVVNITTKKHKIINLGDDRVIFDEKTGVHQVFPIKKSTYDIDDTQEEEK